jgi:CPA1 family monovalent cation:H+ antiporter
MENIEIVVLLLFAVTFLVLLSNRFNFPFPIVLVITGLLISFIPGLPQIVLKPEMVFLIFLPPLLYAAAWNMSWHDFRSNLRPISLAAIGLVFFTTAITGLAVHYFIPGLSWAEAFLIGAIVSPPDAVAATSVTKGLGLNPRIIAILEGESLVNDASGLIAYKYALAAVLTGHFVFWEAGMQFFIVVIAGIGIGLAMGYIMYVIHKNFICDSIIEVTLTFLTPFAAYLIAEHFHVSGVLAVVTTGLYLSYRSDEIFTHQSRIQAYAVWEVVVFILNGLIFILLGLQLKYIIKELNILDDFSGFEFLWFGLVISIIVIIIRFVWVIPAALLPRVFSKRIRETESFDPRNMLVFAWSGMRGVVSMAAALALPLTLSDNTPFTNRAVIVFITFCVIIFTLVVQGLSLPYLIKLLKMPRYSVLAEEHSTRMEVVGISINHIEENLTNLNENLLAQIKNKYEVKYNRLRSTELPADFFTRGRKDVTSETEQNTANATVDIAEDLFNQFTNLQLKMIAVERDVIKKLHHSGKTSEEILRKLERELDLEETRLQMEMYDN